MHNNNSIVPYISLCSGYEGIGLGLHRCIPNLRCIGYCEREAFAISNLVAKMENGLLDAAPVFTDVTTFPWRDYAPFMAGGILSFGWPCQPVSTAGKRKATEDE
jgi:DNA (cytosine-5)-methyltransferase 1